MLLQAPADPSGTSIANMVFIFAAMFGPVFIIFVIGALFRRPSSKRKHRLLEHVLDRDDLAPAERQALVAALIEISRPPRYGAKALFTLGWMGIFAGGMLWWLGEYWGPMTRQDYDILGIAVLVGSVALATLPIALGELDQRRSIRSEEVRS